ncbi:MAG: chromate transporter, partial [Anaeromassilibacillus sp.]
VLSMQETRVVQGALSGLRPAVVGLITAAAFSVCVTSFFPEGIFTAVNWIGVCIFALALVLLLWKKPHPILLILFSAGLGIVFCTIQERFIA